MHPVLLDIALVGYICATGLALAYLIQRDELVHRLGSAATVGAWACHTIGLVTLAIESGRPPFGTLPAAISVAVWVIVLLTLWAERQYQLRVLPAFVLPIVVVLSFKSVTARPALEAMAPTLGGAWVWVHIALALIGIAAFVLNFAGAIMYLLQERQLKTKRPGAFYYRLPALDTLDRLSYRTLALGFPFLTTGLILGAVWAQVAWGSVFTTDPMAIFSLLAWIIYAGTLAGRAAGGWHGRRAAYFAVFGFLALVLTLGAGLFLPGRHGS